MNNTPGVILRDAHLSDVSAMASLLVELGYPTSDVDMQNRFSQIVRHPDMKTLIAEIDGTLVGLIGLSKHWAYERNGIYVRVLALVVSDAHRGQGIGWKLMTSAEAWANEMGAVRMVVNCGNREERIKAKAFYQHFGFELNSSGYIKKILTLSS